MKKNKAYKFRLYPDKEQRILIVKTFGCCRFVWNYMLSLQKKADELADFRYTLYDMNMMLPKMKKLPETAWLKEVDSSALQLSLKDLDTAFKRWNEIPDTGKPKFKSKLLAYKLADRGKHLVKIDRWYLSSQICHACGYKNPVTKDISVRTVTCPVCGRVYDRDRNAAENIRDEGWRIYQSGILRSA